MQTFNHYHQHPIYQRLHSSFALFDLSIWLHVFARSLISIFVPIFLLQLNYSLIEVVFYFCLFNLFNLPLNFFGRWLVQKVGARRVIILGNFFLVLFFCILYNLQPDSWILLLSMALSGAMYDALYWVAHIFFFLKCEHGEENISKDMSFLVIARRLAGLLAPFLGALVLIFLNKHALIFISITLLFLSVWPLFKMKNINDKPEKKPKSIGEFMDSWNVFKDYIATGLFGIHGAAESIVWPMFIFVLLGSIESVAALPIIISITSIIFIYFTGKLDKKSRELLIALGGLLIALTWIGRLAIDNTIWFYASVFLIGFFIVLIQIPLSSNIYEKGKVKSALNTATYRNFFSMLFQFLFFSILLLLLHVFTVGFIVAMISMFALALLSFVFRKSRILAE